MGHLAAGDENGFQAVREGMDRAATTLQGTADPGEVGQEKLDFLAMTAGIKPVFVAGRGVDAPGWTDALAALAAERGLTAFSGPFWDATSWGELPRWYGDHCRAALSAHRALYICAAEETAAAASAICEAGGAVSQADEARLLGYPPCCVAAHYDRAMRYHHATLSMLRRHGADDPARMGALLSGSANMAPATEEEMEDLDAAYDIRPAPFGSWNMCRPCAETADSPSARLSAEYRRLATELSPELLTILECESAFRPG